MQCPCALVCSVAVTLCSVHVRVCSVDVGVYVFDFHVDFKALLSCMSKVCVLYFMSMFEIF